MSVAAVLADRAVVVDVDVDADETVLLDPDEDRDVVDCRADGMPRQNDAIEFEMLLARDPAAPKTACCCCSCCCGGGCCRCCGGDRCAAAVVVAVVVAVAAARDGRIRGGGLESGPLDGGVIVWVWPPWRCWDSKRDSLSAGTCQEKGIEEQKKEATKNRRREGKKGMEGSGGQRGTTNVRDRFEDGGGELGYIFGGRDKKDGGCPFYNYAGRLERDGGENHKKGTKKGRFSRLTRFTRRNRQPADLVLELGNSGPVTGLCRDFDIVVVVDGFTMIIIIAVIATVFFVDDFGLARPHRA